MREDPEVLEKLKEHGMSPVTTEQGEQVAVAIKAVNYMECSSLTQRGLKEVFDFAIKTALDRKGKSGKKGKGGCTLL